jgi:hypothetical protein
MKIFKLVLFTLTFLNISIGCKSKSVNDLKIIEVHIVDYGKIHLDKTKIDKLSSITKINKKHFTSSIYYINEKNTIGIPINDKLFNHDFFNNYDYENNKKVKVYLKKYIYENKDYFIAIKIE